MKRRSSSRIRQLELYHQHKVKVVELTALLSELDCLLSSPLWLAQVIHPHSKSSRMVELLSMKARVLYQHAGSDLAWEHNQGIKQALS